MSRQVSDRASYIERLRAATNVKNVTKIYQKVDKLVNKQAGKQLRRIARCNRKCNNPK